MLEKSEIKKLFEFVKQRDVEYVDLQIEIVDHLATEIEINRKSNPNLDFDEALSVVDRKFAKLEFSQQHPHYGFPVKYSGFKSIVREKELYTSKYLNRRMNDYLKSFFKLPKILLTLALWGLIYTIIDLGYLEPLSYSFIVSILVTLVYWGVKTFYFQKKNGKFLSLTFQNGTLLALPMYTLLYPLFELIKWMDNTTIYFPIVVSAIFTFLILCGYIAYVHFTDLLISEIEEKYVKLNINLT